MWCLSCLDATGMSERLGQVFVIKYQLNQSSKSHELYFRCLLDDEVDFVHSKDLLFQSHAYACIRNKELCTLKRHVFSL